MIKMYQAILINLIGVAIITLHYDNVIKNINAENRMLQEKVWNLTDENNEMLYSNRIMYRVTVTTYNPTRRQCDSTPNITADGTRINPKKATQYRYVALSRDLLSRWGGPFEYGDYIVIEGTDGRDGIYQVRDTMNPRWTNRVDILTTNSRFKYDNIVMYKYVEEYLVNND
jgi:3D (Asp-Asp-Asp) domain-containing protein